MENRASQFLTYECYNGLKKMLEEKEKAYEQKIELCEEQSQILSNKLINLQKGNFAKITFYNGHNYQTLSGSITLIDELRRKIILNEKIVINIDNIYDIIC